MASEFTIEELNYINNVIREPVMTKFVNLFSIRKKDYLNITNTCINDMCKEIIDIVYKVDKLDADKLSCLLIINPEKESKSLN
jgi:hypothetical protein